MTRQRRSRIHLLGRFFDYPLQLGNVVSNLPPTLLARALADYLAVRVRDRFRPIPDAHFESWVVKRFGRTLYELFFGTYTQKAWGMPCDQISADWAAQRISQANLWDAIAQTLWPRASGEARSLAREFLYPARGGIGQLARKYAEKIARAGGEIRLGATVDSLELEGERVARVVVTIGGVREGFECDEVVSTIPLPATLRALRRDGEPVLTGDEQRAADDVRFVAIVFVYLEVDRPQAIPDHWIYLPEPALTVHRISEPKNFSDSTAPHASTALCCEITCRVGDARWKLELPEAAAIARADLVRVGVLAPGEGRALAIRRLAHAYPVYDLAYRSNVQTLRAALRPIENLTSTGRQGLFRYNNMDHSIAMGRKAAAAAFARVAQSGERASATVVEQLG